MKILLDENIPRKLKGELVGFDVSTVQELGWSGIQNGALLDSMIKSDFDVLITADKNLKNQQNFQYYTVPVLVLNVILLTFNHILPLIPTLKP